RIHVLPRLDGSAPVRRRRDKCRRNPTGLSTPKVSRKYLKFYSFSSESPFESDNDLKLDFKNPPLGETNRINTTLIQLDFQADLNPVFS
ncbi:MAG: hypothetical protein ABEK50_17630, partial [bacterium]